MQFSIDDVICFYWWFYRDPLIVCQYPSMRLRTDAMLRTWHHITKFSDEEMPKVSYLWKSYTALYFLHFMLIYTVLVSVSWSMEAFLSGLDKKFAFTFKQGQRSVWPRLGLAHLSLFERERSLRTWSCCYIRCYILYAWPSLATWFYLFGVLLM